MLPEKTNRCKWLFSWKSQMTQWEKKGLTKTKGKKLKQHPQQNPQTHLKCIPAFVIPILVLFRSENYGKQLNNAIVK